MTVTLPWTQRPSLVDPQTIRENALILADLAVGDEVLVYRFDQGSGQVSCLICYCGTIHEIIPEAQSNDFAPMVRVLTFGNKLISVYAATLGLAPRPSFMPPLWQKLEKLGGKTPSELAPASWKRNTFCVPVTVDPLQVTEIQAQLC